MPKLITPEFRGSFVHLAEPKAPAPGADPVYSMVIVLPKEDAETKKFMKDLKAAVELTAKEKFGKLPKKLKKPWKDGDEEDRPEWEGCWAIPAKSKSRPGVVNGDLQPVMDPDDLQSGYYYRAAISEWGWSHPTGGQGVSLNLDNVQYVREGEPFSSRASAEDDFADYRSESTEEEQEEEDVEF